MKIELIERGFIQHLDNLFVEKIHCSYDGSCKVYYYNGASQTLLLECSSYNSQYGYQVSEDGETLFANSWGKGLTAYNIQTNTVIWKLKRTKITNVVVYPTYIVVARDGAAVLKLDIESGEVLTEFKSGTIERIWELQVPYVLVESIKGNLAVVNTEQMSIVRTYNKRIVNPNCCCSMIIQDLRTENNALTILGLEECPGWDMTLRGQKPFARVIDTNLYEGL